MAFPKWSVILNRMDKLGQKFWTEWRANVVTQGPAAPGDIPMIGPGGVIDPSLLPGSTGGAVITTIVTSAEVIGAFQVVAVHSDGLLYLADFTSVADASQTIGLATTSAVAPGLPVTVQEVGFLSNLGWNWSTPGKTLYLGATGTLTTTVPTVGAAFELPMGTVISNTQIELLIGLPIILA